MNRWYWAYAAAIVAGLAYVLYFGWSMTGVDQVKHVPKSIRDNPGAYRAHYASYRRYHWGK